MIQVNFKSFSYPSTTCYSNKSYSVILSEDVAPSYLSEFVMPYKPTRNLRSSNKFIYSVPASRSVTFGNRAFAVAGPKIWNTLPKEMTNSPTVDILKSKLKTYLFNT